MKKLISNRLNMYGSVLSTLNSNPSAWNNVPAFAEAVAEFTQKLAAFRTAVLEEDTVRSGVRDHRDQLVDELRNLLIRMVHIMQLVAEESGDALLKGRYKLQPHLIRTLSLRELDLLCGHLDEDLEANSDAAAHYGLGSGEVTVYQGLRAQLDDLTTMVRDSIIRHSGMLQEIDEQGMELNRLLKRMDKMVYSLSDDAEAFARSYRRSRHTLKPGTHHSPPESDAA